jgi:hypothetical protein
MCSSRSLRWIAGIAADSSPPPPRVPVSIRGRVSPIDRLVGATQVSDADSRVPSETNGSSIETTASRFGRGGSIPARWGRIERKAIHPHKRATPAWNAREAHQVQACTTEERAVETFAHEDAHDILIDMLSPDKDATERDSTLDVAVGKTRRGAAEPRAARIWGR